MSLRASSVKVRALLYRINPTWSKRLPADRNLSLPSSTRCGSSAPLPLRRDQGELGQEGPDGA
jgi:hypothetical protein